MDEELFHYYAGLAMLGLIQSKEPFHNIPRMAQEMAELMLTKPEGIVAVKTKKEKK
jgi:selenophosphate synthase